MVLNHWVLGALHFKTALWSHLHGSKCPRRIFFRHFDPLRCCLKTSGTNYLLTQHHIPKEHGSQPNHFKSRKTCTVFYFGYIFLLLWSSIFFYSTSLSVRYHCPVECTVTHKLISFSLHLKMSLLKYETFPLTFTLILSKFCGQLQYTLHITYPHNKVKSG